MRGDFADLEVVVDEAFHAVDDLAARDDGAADVVHGDAGFREKRVHCLFEGAEVAVSACGALADACHARRLHRFCALIGRMFNFSVLAHEDCLEGRGTDVDSQVVFLICHKSLVLKLSNFSFKNISQKKKKSTRFSRIFNSFNLCGKNQRAAGTVQRRPAPRGCLREVRLLRMPLPRFRVRTRRLAV